MLNKVMEEPQGMLFENWIFHFIEVLVRMVMINWEKVISDNLNMQSRNLERTKTFYMIYLFVKNIKYTGLICKGEVGNKKGQLKIYECHPQLQLYKKGYIRGYAIHFLHISVDYYIYG